MLSFRLTSASSPDGSSNALCMSTRSIRRRSLSTIDHPLDALHLFFPRRHRLLELFDLDTTGFPAFGLHKRYQKQFSPHET